MLGSRTGSGPSSRSSIIRDMTRYPGEVFLVALQLQRFVSMGPVLDGVSPTAPTRKTLSFSCVLGSENHTREPLRDASARPQGHAD